MPNRVKTKYQSNDDTIHVISLTPDYAAVAGTPPGGAVDSDIKVKVTKTNREHGIRPRGVRLYRFIGDPPEQAIRYGFLPVLTETAWEGAGFAPETTITIGSNTWKVLARQPEDY